MTDVLNDRAKAILAGLIEEYIATGRPVGSRHLVDTLHLDASPATVRGVLHALEDAGFIHQPHTSAGRVPTDSGYRYYVDNLRPKHLAQNELKNLRAEYLSLEQRYQHLAHSTSKLLAALAGAVTVSHDNETTHLSGLKELLDQSDEEALPAAREVSNLIDILDEDIEQVGESASDEPTVFIGAENPIMPTEHTSMLVRKVELENGRNLVVIVLGPKRMAYRRNMSLLEALNEIL